MVLPLEEQDDRSPSQDAEDAESDTNSNLLDFSDVDASLRKLKKENEKEKVRSGEAAVVPTEGGGENIVPEAEEGSARDGSRAPLENEIRSFEMRFGSRYLQIIGVSVISMAFSILGYYPSDIIPVWGQVAFMFLGAAVLLLAGDILIAKREMEFYALGIIFAGIKLVYSSFLGMFHNFDLIDGMTLAGLLVLTLALHYWLSLRYRSPVLNSSFVLLSWVPLVLIHDSVGHDDLIFIGIIAVMVLNYLQAHKRDDTTTLLAVPASLFIFLLLTGSEQVIYDVRFDLFLDSLAVVPCLLIFAIVSCWFLDVHKGSTTLLSGYLKEMPGTTFDHLMSLLLVLSGVAGSQFMSTSQIAFLLLFIVSALIVVHFRPQERSIPYPLLIPPGMAALVSLATVIAIMIDPLSLPLLVGISFLIIYGVLGRTKLSLLMDGSYESTILLVSMGMILTSMLVTVLSPDSIDFVPAIALILAIVAQLYTSHSSIRDIHIITAEITILIGVAAFGWSTGDHDAYSVVWLIVLVITWSILMWKKDGGLATSTLLILAVSLLATYSLFSDLFPIPAAILIGSLFAIGHRYSGPYFLHKLLIPGNEISTILKRNKILDLYLVTLLVSLVISLTSLHVVEDSWPLFSITSFLFLYGSLTSDHRKLAHPILVLCASAVVVYSNGLLFLVYATIFPIVLVLLYYHPRVHPQDSRHDQFLLMIIFLTVGLAVGIEDLRDPWLTTGLNLDRVMRLTVVYGFYLIGLIASLSLTKRLSNFLFTGIIALCELLALLMFTFEYQYGIQFFFILILMQMGYFGLILRSRSPGGRDRIWERDRDLLFFLSSVFFILPLLLFNYLNEVPEWEAWTYGLIGLGIVLASDIQANGIHPLESGGRRGRLRGRRKHLVPGLSLTDAFALLFPALLCMNYSESTSLWLFLVVFALVPLLLLFRESRSRIDLISLYALFFFLPFNILLLLHDSYSDPLHPISDLIPVSLVVLYVLMHELRGVYNSFRSSSRYQSTLTLGVLLLGTAGCSSWGLFAIPILMFVFCLRRKDVLATPASYVVFMFITNLYFGSYRGETDMAMNVLLLLSILPIFLALLNEYASHSKTMTFSFSTLAFFLMGSVPWFAANGGSFIGTIITSVIWTIFGGTAFSAGFYLDRRYLKFYGFFFLGGGIMITVYNTATLGVELVVGSLLVFGVIALIASYFYYLSLLREKEGEP